MEEKDNVVKIVKELIKEVKNIERVDKESNKEQSFNEIADEFMTSHRCVQCDNVPYYYNQKEKCYCEITDKEEDALGRFTCRRKKNFSKNVLRCVFSCVKSKIENAELSNLINVRNGLLNPITKELIPHTCKEVTISKLPVEFNPDSKSDLFDRVLGEILPDFLDQKLFFQMCGYTLFNDCSRQVGFFLASDGNSGKSTLISLLETVLGRENITSMPIQELDDTKFGLSCIVGKKAIINSDVTDTLIKSTGIIKRLIAGESLSIKRKFQDNLDYRSTAKLIFLCNSLPFARDLSHGWFRRWVFIPFTECFEGREERGLDAKLRNSGDALSSFFNKMLTGYNSLINNEPFAESENSKKLKEDYKSNSNPYSDFVKEYLVLDDNGYLTLKEAQDKLNDNYVNRKLLRSNYLKENMTRALNDIFNKKFEYSRNRLGNKRVRCWKGVRLKTHFDRYETVGECSKSDKEYLN